MFILANVFGWNFQFGAGAEFKPTSYITDLVGETPSAPARIAFGFIIITIIFVTLLVAQAGKRWEAAAKTKGGTAS
jgi:neurotransmitter:Na+ symporter, NSS family